MTITDLQQWVKDDWEINSNHRPTVELQLLYILEELGEVAEAIRKTSGLKNRKQSDVNLGSELADLIISVTTLANHFDVNLQKEVEAFQLRLIERHKNGF